ncbi:MAG: hypothetical protein WBA61_13850 [Aequorivita sp.]
MGKSQRAQILGIKDKARVQLEAMSGIGFIRKAQPTVFAEPSFVL